MLILSHNSKEAEKNERDGRPDKSFCRSIIPCKTAEIGDSYSSMMELTVELISDGASDPPMFIVVLLRVESRHVAVFGDITHPTSPKHQHRSLNTAVRKDPVRTLRPVEERSSTNRCPSFA